MAQIDVPDLDSVSRGLFEFAYAIRSLLLEDPDMPLEFTTGDTSTVVLSAIVATTRVLRSLHDKKTKEAAEAAAMLLVTVSYILLYLGESGVDTVQLADLYKKALEAHEPIGGKK
ncbi:MAG: hypothetical protein ACXABY_00955 [Candidatus Thorarchaeota archaeon]|jgi:hypothetical protein